jgi:hypothetical protein
MFFASNIKHPADSEHQTDARKHQNSEYPVG